MLLFLIDHILKLLQLPHELKVMKSLCCPELHQQEHPIGVEWLCLATCDLGASAHTHANAACLKHDSIHPPFSLFCAMNLFFPPSMLNLKGFDFGFFVFVYVVKVLSDQPVGNMQSVLALPLSNTCVRSASIWCTYIFSCGTQPVMLVRL